jgi:type II secretory ATPase GspE/PulE/Tfp pilus assembly ATPase PilB-like protein
MKILIAVTLAAAVALGAALPETQAEKAGAKAQATPTAAPTEAEVVRAQKPSYPLDTCVVSGHKLDDKAIDVVVDGRLVRLCCADCKATAEKDKAAWMAKVDAAVIVAQKPAYPLATCPISGEKLTSKGEGFDVVYGTRLVRLCCQNCKPAFDKDPTAAMAKVDKAWIEAQLPTYPLETCPVSGEKLGGMGEPVNVLYGTKLIRLCCKSCKKAVEKDGPALVAKIEAARKK